MLKNVKIIIILSISIVIYILFNYFYLIIKKSYLKYYLIKIFLFNY